MAPLSDQRVDALIIGAGPAGSAAAIALASNGARVTLVDRHRFPRDKICGDALIPDALGALDRLSLKKAVLARARVMHRLRLYAPNERVVEIAGECACVPRALLDDVLRSEAVACGARFQPDLTLASAVAESGVVGGATFTTRDGRSVTVRADTTILATGAAAEPLKRFNVCQRVMPSATAARVYFKADDALAADFDHLCISYDRAICPGYGWIFPGPRGVFNVGVGYFYDTTARPPETNIRKLLDTFLTRFAPARRVKQHSRQITPIKGAPLRTALTGATLATPGLLVVGEAAGLTYSFSGEGIGKAIESGLIAADVIRSASSGGMTAAAVAAEYSSRIRDAFGARFRAYKMAQGWLTAPIVINLLAWRAAEGQFVREQLEGVFQETVDPRQLFSIAGAVRSLIS